jgi:hypothetical protein
MSVPDGFELTADNPVNDKSAAKDQNRNAGPKDKYGHLNLLLLPAK